jgi:hypothetical protein
MLKAKIPCIGFFSCLSPDTNSYINFRILAYKYTYTDTLSSIPVRILPQPFPVEYNASITSCPNKVFNWIYSKINSPCDSVNIAVSIDNGITFSFITSVDSKSGGFLWRIPSGLPDEILIRFCCDNSCVRTDTVLTNFEPKYIDIVAPNPFKPLVEIMEVVYKVPTETNITIRIYDEFNRLVAEPVKNQSRLPGIAYCDKWTGDISGGAIAANGMYYLSLEFSNGVKEIYPVFVRK